MKCYPEYATNIVVAAITEGRLRWFVSEKEEWFLDVVSFARAFGETPTEAEAELVSSLVRGEFQPFLNKLTEYEVERNELREWMEMIEEGSNEWSESLPTAVIDFDQRKVLNSFPEPSGMIHDYVPVGWTADYVSDFNDIERSIPKTDRYWYAK